MNEFDHIIVILNYCQLCTKKKKDCQLAHHQKKTVCIYNINNFHQTSKTKTPFKREKKKTLKIQNQSQVVIKYNSMIIIHC